MDYPNANFTAELPSTPSVGQVAEESGLPSTVPTEKLDQPHPDYKERLEAWQDIDWLCQSGWRVKAKAEHFLKKRQKELAEVFAARVQNVTYQNILGTIIRWYVAAMYKESVDFKIGSPDGETGEVKTLASDKFYAAFLEDCDRAGCKFIDFAKEFFRRSLQFGRVYTLTDLPTTATETPAASLADQKAMGALDPYIVLYDPRQILNWETDSYGNLEWVVIATTSRQQQFAASPKVVDTWYYFDRTTYAVYQSTRKNPATKEKTANLVASGLHALADVGRVPLRKFELPEDLWLANAIYLHCQEHFDTDNALGWGIKQGCLPVLYVKGDLGEPPVRSEVSYIQVPSDGEIGYIQPDASTFEIAAGRVASIREEIYREAHLQAQGRSSSATASANSGYSKELDMMPGRDILSGLSDLLRPGLAGVLRDVCDARGDSEMAIEIRGLEFDETDEAGEMAKFDMFQESDLALKSPTLEREISKKAWRNLLPDASADLAKTIDAEIDKAPSKVDQQNAMQEQAQARMAQSLQNGIDRAESKSVVSEIGS